MHLFIAILVSVGHSLGLMGLLLLGYSEIINRLSKKPAARQLIMGLFWRGLGYLDARSDHSGARADRRRAQRHGGPGRSLRWPHRNNYLCVDGRRISRLARRPRRLLQLGGSGRRSLGQHRDFPVHSQGAGQIQGSRSVPARYRGVFLGRLHTALAAGSAKLFLTEAAAPLMMATFLGVVLLGGLLVRALRHLRTEDTILTWALIDVVTNLPNRRGFEIELARTVAAAKRNSEPLALLMLDIDHFKKVNDKYGHDVGDEVLASRRENFQAAARQGDFVARFGGEEFAVIVRNQEIEAAKSFAERLRILLQKTPIQTSGGLLSITTSIGVAELTSDGRSLVSEADQALYLAKSSGRNRVAAYRLLASRSPLSLARRADGFFGDRARPERPSVQPTAWRDGLAHRRRLANRA